MAKDCQYRAVALAYITKPPLAPSACSRADGARRRKASKEYPHLAVPRKLLRRDLVFRDLTLETPGWISVQVPRTMEPRHGAMHAAKGLSSDRPKGSHHWALEQWNRRRLLSEDPRIAPGSTNAQPSNHPSSSILLPKVELYHRHDHVVADAAAGPGTSGEIASESNPH